MQADVTVNRLLGDCPRLLESTADGDVALVCKGGAAVRAHRLILSVASPVLRDILAAAPAAVEACSTTTAPRKRRKVAAEAAPIAGSPLALPCEGDCPVVWRKLLALLYPVGPGEQQLDWRLLEGVLRLADKCARARAISLCLRRHHLRTHDSA
jgi:hypothetical protein